jgi:alanine racemase
MGYHRHMIRLDDLVEATGGRVVGRPPESGTFPGFAHDSRNVRGGELFVAVRTAIADGHDHVRDALDAGAAGALVDRLPDGQDIGQGVALIVVADVRDALQRWAMRHLTRLAPRVVAVTGTAGKTTATTAIATVLGSIGTPDGVFENANRNDLLGLPLALGDLEARHRVAVLELATDRAGEIGALAAVCRPETAVLLGIVPDAEPFDDVDDAITEYLAAATHARHLVVNVDDERLARAADTWHAEAPFARTITTIGTSPRAAIRAVDTEPGAAGLTLSIFAQGVTTRRVGVALHGAHWVPAILATVAVAMAHGHASGAAIAALARVRPVAGRLAPRAGIRGSLILDDTFSASVASTMASLDAVATRPRPRLVVLGNIGGNRAPNDADVARLGARVAAVADAVVAVGDGADAVAKRARLAREAHLDTSRILTSHRPAEAAARAASVIEEPWHGPARTRVPSTRPWRKRKAPALPVPAGADENPWTILVKGNARARLESVVARLLEDPATATTLLVRQDRGARQVVHTGRDRPAWLEIDLDAIAGNVEALVRVASPAAVMAVLKADAYGHGAVRVARTVLHHGATALATAVLSEAADLRAAGIAAPILVLGHLPPWQARDAVHLNVAVTVFDDEAARHLSDAALAVGRTVAAHVKVDTGLRRIGLEPADVVPFGHRLTTLPGLAVEGIYTHLATADAADQSFAREQLARFSAVITAWSDAGLARPRWVHVANSAATVHLPEARLNLVRPGIALYGIAPGPEAPLPADFRAALQLKTRIAQVKQVHAGETVSYGRTWVARSSRTIGVLPVGYGDGLRRGPRTWGGALVRGQRVPFVGRICMDMCMIDVTGVPGVRAGDHAVLIGTQGNDSITVEEVARHSGTSPYEVTTQILARVPREVVGTGGGDDP